MVQAGIKIWRATHLLDKEIVTAVTINSIVAWESDETNKVTKPDNIYWAALCSLLECQYGCTHREYKKVPHKL